MTCYIGSQIEQGGLAIYYTFLHLELPLTFCSLDVGKLRTNFPDKHHRQRTPSPCHSRDSTHNSCNGDSDTLHVDSFETLSDIESDTSHKYFSSTYEDADQFSPRQFGLFDMACATRHRLGHSNKCPSTTSSQPPREEEIPYHHQG